MSVERSAVKNPVEDVIVVHDDGTVFQYPTSDETYGGHVADTRSIVPLRG